MTNCCDAVLTDKMACEKEEDNFFLERNPMSSGARERESLQLMKQDSAVRQLGSTRRAMASIDESERIGVATAEVSRHLVFTITPTGH